MKHNLKSLRTILLITGMAVAIIPIATSCNSNRFITYEDGMFDDDDIYTDDSRSDTYQINRHAQFAPAP